MKLYAIKNTKTGEYVTFTFEHMYESLGDTYRYFDYHDSDIYFQDYEINLKSFMNLDVSGRVFADAKCGNLEVVEVTLP